MTSREILDPDIDLVSRAKQGELNAFADLVSRHERSVYGIVSRMVRDRDEVDDVVQDVFVQTYRSLDRFRGDAMFGTWLHSIAVNTTLKHLRRAKTRQHLSLDDPLSSVSETLASPNPGPPGQAEAGERRGAVRAAIDRLPEKQRVVVLLHYFEEYSCEEIANMLGLSVGTVWSRLHYACRRLQGHLEWLNEAGQ